MEDKTIKCQHYKGSGYEYTLTTGLTLLLCPLCEGHLLAKMKEQEVIETKMSRIMKNKLDDDEEEKLFLEAVKRGKLKLGKI